MKKSKTPLPPPRVRKEPPTLQEAFIAAQGLTPDIEQQIVIAAGLMGVAEDEVRPHVPKAPPPDRTATSLMVRNRVVTVERRGSRLAARPSLAQFR
jgi:hypothetical protein